MENNSWFTTLYDTYADAIWRYFMMRLGNKERAEELTHDTFLRIWQAVESGATLPENEQAYVYTVAKRLFINEIRSKRVVVSYDDLAESGFEVINEADMTSLVAEQRELWQYLDTIKPSYKEVLILRYMDGLPVKDIAVLLSEKETNISMRIKRGLEALRTAYTHLPV